MNKASTENQDERFSDDRILKIIVVIFVVVTMLFLLAMTLFF